MKTVTQTLTLARRVRQPPLPIDFKTYMRELAFVASQAAKTSDPRVRRLSAQLLALQAPRLAAMATESL